MPHVVSVNVSLPVEVPHRGKTVRTGIFKQPVSGRVRVHRTHLEGDGQADRRVHGGPDKAVYAYPSAYYDYWREQLGRDDLPPGQFGENLTLAGWTDDSVHIGDVFRAGGTRLEVSQPRFPCFKLGIRMGSADFPKRFLAAGRLGFYLRVLEEGEVCAGDAFERIAAGPERLSVERAARLLHFERGDLDGARTALRIPALSESWRSSFEELLAKAGASI